MAYKNLYLRLFFSFCLILIYLIVSLINFKLVFYLILIIYILILTEIYLYFEKFKLLPFIYVSISFIFFMSIDFNNNMYLKFNFFILIVILFDSFSYIFGKLFGKNKLIKISPNKTVEGLFGGLVSALFLGLFFANLFQISIDAYLIFFIFITIFFAFIGDIIESFFKRKNNLKNSSKSLPGHGGVFDRFDSFLFSIIFYSISFNFYLWTLIYMEALEL